MCHDQILVGRTLTGIKLATDKKAILFQTTEGDVIAKADGDCCSSTWVESIEMPARGFPAVVSAAESISMPGQESEDEYSELACYGFRLTTDAGHIIIDYRNGHGKLQLPRFKGFETAHRASYAAFVGDVPANTYVCHKCDTALCVNPDHLYIGGPHENMRDMAIRGRSRQKLTFDQVREIRLSVENATILSERYGVHRSSIQSVRNFRTFSYLKSSQD